MSAIPQVQYTRGDFTISTDRARLDLAVIHGFLSQSYWSKGIPMEIVQRAIEHSLCFGVYHLSQQVGFARLITDYTTFAYLADVFIVEAYRGQGLSKWLVESILKHPDVQGLRRWMLATRDAHGLYRQFGFEPLDDPSRFMQITNLDIYLKMHEQKDR
ncbi:MAG TPA: GNAT family N-acetyltransferase [Aggregatilineales bacterium]|nr:GNAT family N-acetyltransferase [Aggregatilineales bacterium]